MGILIFGITAAGSIVGLLCTGVIVRIGARRTIIAVRSQSVPSDSLSPDGCRWGRAWRLVVMGPRHLGLDVRFRMSQ
jgi:hypothetical protein